MIKLFIGGKGSGKTKTLIELSNNAANTSKGSVICIEKGSKLRHEITYKARLIVMIMAQHGQRQRQVRAILLR